MSIQQLYYSAVGRIPMTRIRMIGARVLYRMVHAVLRRDHHIIRRNGVCYEVDLSEGIDLSLFLFGHFQDYVADSKYLPLSPDALVFDVGANVGSMAFRFAQRAPAGRVYAVEPTHYAFGKLQRNLALNPKLASRITPVQLFFWDQTTTDHGIRAYASWKVDGESADRHPLHGGSVQSAQSVAAVTLDEFCSRNRIQRVDLIKIDTDGHEYRVLKGARQTLERCRPHIIFEIGLYVMQEGNITFDDYYSYLRSFDYELINAKNGHMVTPENFRYEIPARSTTDIIAVPPAQSHPEKFQA